ncbi:MAG: hypothetical protein Q9165_002093 [Trypethelium subeluteriae]
MGDTGDAGRPQLDPSRREYTGDPNQPFSIGYPDSSSAATSSEISQEVGPHTGNSPFFSQYSALPQLNQPSQAHRPGSQQNAMSFNVSPNHDPSFNMAAMAEALSNYPGGQPQHAMSQRPPQAGQQPLSGASTSALVYQLQQISQYPGQAGAPYPGQPGVAPGYAGNPYPNVYSQRSGGPSPTQQSYPQVSPQSQPYYYYPNQYGQTAPSPTYVAHPGQMSGPFDKRFSFPQAPNMGQQNPYALQQQVRMGPSIGGSGVASQMGGADSTFSTAVPRGPPRKPKQSGHALWVGNLPPGTTVLDLKDHFSRDATEDIESLFLISKSNCAFVNYRTESSCVAAMHRFHDSRFNGVRLVCRLRRTSAPASGVPTGPAAMMAGSPSGLTSPPAKAGTEQTSDQDEPEIDQEPTETVDLEAESKAKVPEKFFVVKSLTLQDLEASVRNGIWATQAHNEETLNKAFETAENVYLIFSANKSGEYFGYARMASPISGDASQYIGSLPQAEEHDSSSAPKSIPTPATAHAPKGRVIDDSARGTIFWEADRSDDEDDSGEADAEETEEKKHSKLGDASPNKENPQDWGKPFKLEWISTQRLPFYRTRGLRNPWNANREVKIARDGTELEPSVGRRLIQMFQRMGPSPQGVPQLTPIPLGSQPQMSPY